jgi:micrococcal nuclease
MTVGGWVTLLLILASLAVSRFGLLHPQGRGNDWETFDRKRVIVTKVADGDTLTIRNGSSEARVRLLGVDAPELHPDGGVPPDHWAERAAAYTRGRSEGKFVTIKLDSTQTRDRYERLLAYVYLSDTDLLNLDLVRDGQAYADRRFKHSLRSQFETAENEARKRGRGLWKDVTVEQMPQWRREWLREVEQRR